MQDHLICEDEEKQGEKVEEELIENTVCSFDALQGLEMARKYIQQFDVDILHISAMQYA
jgi:hypothetical protein